LLSTLRKALALRVCKWRSAPRAKLRPEAADAPPRIRIHGPAHAGARCCSNPQMAFGSDAYSEGRLEIEGNLTRTLEKNLYRIPEWSYCTPGFEVAHLGPDQQPAWFPRQIFIATTISPMTSTECGSIRRWSTPALIFRNHNDGLEKSAGSQARSGLSQNSGSAPVNWWWRPGAAGERWPCIWPRFDGVRVRAFNISREQLAFARKRAQAWGLASRVESSKTTTATSAKRPMSRFHGYARTCGPAAG